MISFKHIWIKWAFISVIVLSVLIASFYTYKRILFESKDNPIELAISYHDLDQLSSHSNEDKATLIANKKENDY